MQPGTGNMKKYHRVLQLTRHKIIAFFSFSFLNYRYAGVNILDYKIEYLFMQTM